MLEMKHITKRFPGIVALNDVSLSLKRGEVHALVGENGAGKSTLIKIIAGVHQPDSGEVRLFGRPVTFTRPRASIEAGIAVVHQERNLIPRFSIAENPQVESDWTVRELAYQDDHCQTVKLPTPFTLIDFVACDARYSKFFAAVPTAHWQDWLSDAGEAIARELMRGLLGGMKRR